MTWYAYRITPGTERTAHAAIERIGIKSLHVTRKRVIYPRHRKSRQPVGRDVPLLVGYALAEFSHAQMFEAWDRRIRDLRRWSPVNGEVRVVRSLLGQIVRGWEELNAMIVLSEQAADADRHHVWRVGDRVRTTAGPFADRSFPIEAMRSDGVIVRVGIIPMHIPASQLQAA